MSVPLVTKVAEANDYLRALIHRKREATSAGRVENSRLPAGSPMYYYCKLCGLLADRLPESHFDAPRRYCMACQEMIDRGFSLSLGKFPGVGPGVIDTYGEEVGPLILIR